MNFNIYRLLKSALAVAFSVSLFAMGLNDNFYPEVYPNGYGIVDESLANPELENYFIQKTAQSLRIYTTSLTGFLSNDNYGRCNAHVSHSGCELWYHHTPKRGSRIVFPMISLTEMDALLIASKFITETLKIQMSEIEVRSSILHYSGEAGKNRRLDDVSFLFLRKKNGAKKAFIDITIGLERDVNMMHIVWPIIQGGIPNMTKLAEN